MDDRMDNLSFRDCDGKTKWQMADGRSGCSGVYEEEKQMKRWSMILLAVSTLLMTAACGSSAGTGAPSPQTAAQAPAAAKEVPVQKGQGKHILVAYFSRTGDNYAVGNIAKGNTHIVADMIAEAVGADTFEIKTLKDYPANYKECTEVANNELEENARPELAAKVPNMQDYDVIFLGYPIWWSDMPMAVYTFMESYDFQGKTIIPFCTSAGDVLTGRESSIIPEHAKGAKVLDGLGIEGKRAQQNPDSVKPEVQKWLAKLGFVK